VVLESVLLTVEVAGLEVADVEVADVEPDEARPSSAHGGLRRRPWWRLPR
jgi:hypothetical protein